MMSFVVLGKSTSAVEVTNVSIHGLWLLAAGRESFLSYTEFPWFKDASLSAIFNVARTQAGTFLLA